MRLLYSSRNMIQQTIVSTQTVELLDKASLPERKNTLPANPEIPPPWASIPHNTEELSLRLLNQDPRLLMPTQKLATVISSLPTDSRFSHVSPRALIVGGFVRDSLMGLSPKDLDLEVYGVSLERLNSILEEHFPNKVDSVGKAFGILKVHIGEGLELDVSIPRRDSKQGSGHKGFQISGDPSMSIKDAAARRDFTWNALAACPLDGEIFDPYQGLSDLRSGILRVTDPLLFKDDPLRVYRAAQFIARMQLSVEDQSFLLMREVVDQQEFTELAQERVTEELKKLLLKSPKPSIGLEMLRALGITQALFPEMHALISVPQDPEWHPEGDVWIHTKMVVDQAARLLRSRPNMYTEDERLVVMFSAICHDFGKPSKTEFIEGRYRSRGHESAGVEPAKQFLARLSLSDSIKQGVLACTAHHMRPCELMRSFEKGKLNEKQVILQVRQLIKRISPLNLETFLTLTEADTRGRGIPGVAVDPYLPGEFIRDLSIKKQIEKQSKSPYLQGRDLIQMGLVAGKQFGIILAEVEQQRDRGKINSREEAIIFVRLKYLLLGSELSAMGIEPGKEFTSIFLNLKSAIRSGLITTKIQARQYAESLIAERSH